MWVRYKTQKLSKFTEKLLFLFLVVIATTEYTILRTAMIFSVDSTLKING